EIDPCVLLHFTSKEAGAIRSFLLQNLSALDERGVIYEEGASLAADDVLGFMEADTTEVAHGSERAIPEARHHALRGIFDYEQPVILRDRSELVHVAPHTGVVDGEDRLRTFGDRHLDDALVD